MSQQERDAWMKDVLKMDVAVPAVLPGGSMYEQVAAAAFYLAKVKMEDRDHLKKALQVAEDMRPSKDDPTKYTTAMGNQEVVISKEKGDALRAQIVHELQMTADNIRTWNHSLQSEFEKAQPNSYGDFVAERTVSIFGAKNPEKEMDKLYQAAYGKISGVSGALSKNQFSHAADLIAGAEADASSAEEVFKRWTSKTQSVGAGVITGLKLVKKVSFTVAKLIATAEFGKAGAAAIDGIEEAADVAGEALAGHDIKWGSHVINLGINLLGDKYGDQAENAIKGKLEGMLENQLIKRVSKSKAKELANKYAEKIAKKAVEKGSDFVKDKLTKEAEKHKGTKMKWSELMQGVITSMGTANGDLEKMAKAAVDGEIKSELAR